MPTYQNLQDDVVQFFSLASSNNMTLLEIASLGNPEQTIQGELLHYLRGQKWIVLQEVGFIIPSIFRPKRNFDMVVFGRGNEKGFNFEEEKYNKAFPKGSTPMISRDKKEVVFGANGHIADCVIIEMKHNAANQSRVCDPNSPNNLIPNLDRDYASCIKGVPLMQVGIFSVMTNIFPFPLLRTGFYRMPKTYFVAKLPRVVPPLPITCCSPSCPSFVAAMAGFCNPLPSWLIPPSISGAAVSADPATGMAVVSAPVPPPPGNFSFRDAGIDYNVEGHVEFFVGIRY